MYGLNYMSLKDNPLMEALILIVTALFVILGVIFVLIPAVCESPALANPRIPDGAGDILNLIICLLPLIAVFLVIQVVSTKYHEFP